MKSKRWLDVVEYNAFADRFDAETDRAAAVLAGGFLDGFLEQVLRSVFFVEYKRNDELFEGNGPLRPFGNKIALAFALGTATESVRRDLDLVRKVRNHFAHHLFEASFALPPVAQWCTALGAGTEESAELRVALQGYTPRQRYLFAVATAMLRLAQSPRIADDVRRRITRIES